MAITTVDGLVAGFQPPVTYFKVGVTMEAVGVMYSPFYRTGMPGAAVAPSPGLGGAALTSYSGQIPYTNPSSGNAYLARFACTATTAGAWILCDRLWHNSGITSTTTTGQTVNSATWPARDRGGATDGDDIMVGIEVSTATSNGSAVTNTTMTYTNSAGTGSKTATITSFPATATLGTFVPFELAAGDKGVRSIQTLTLGTSYGTGTIHLVAYRILARGVIPLANAGSDVDFLRSGGVRLYDDTVPFLLWVPSVTTATTFWGHMTCAHG